MAEPSAEQLRDPITLTPRSAVQQSVEVMRQLSEEGGSHNFVIFDVDDCRYVQLGSSCGSAVMYGEVSSGRYFTPRCTFALTATQRKRLLSLGWRPPTKRKFLNFYRYWPFVTGHDHRAMAEIVVATVEAMGWDGTPLPGKLHLDW
jgi:hypothetical protein